MTAPAPAYSPADGHVLFDAPSGRAPDRIEIEMHTDPRDLTQVATLSILLFRDGRAGWHQANDSGGEVDVAALELDRSAMPRGHVVRAFGPQHLPAGFDLFEVGDRLTIPGFPLGFFDTVHHLPIVRQASIASAYGTRFQGLGFFLTDARMHRGSSGSPVLKRTMSRRMAMVSAVCAADSGLPASPAGRVHWGSLHEAWRGATAARAGAARSGKEPLPVGVLIAIAEHRMRAMLVMRDALGQAPGLRRPIDALQAQARDAQGRN